ncbi:G-type lectin S-receptor-like serine/threonine-protein kinase At1g11330 isoform X2 [Quercus robur]|uniref:G-type lectin S-receptor-like serine/threonine-protein kinase At1g11330 isoform X2 n=1 Tax=Quercus robur TaxID=38942 RepID=UPI002161E82A|nr:G-type lectin S-receptor-like serine/threonine-protein kinase At1g11330 isoform X2 [Quercus robur]
MKRSNDLIMLLASKIFIHSIEQAMGSVRNTSMSVLLVLLCCICLEFGSATNTITASRPIKDPDFIISNNGSAFKLGFFHPKNSTNRYVGIWYNNISAVKVVWVANREKPLRDSKGVLTISEKGVLVLLNGEKEVIWSANVANSAPNSSAQLLDSGNLVLQENATGTVIWESFQYPSDTVLPTMKLSANVRTGKKVQITSWKSPSDPSIGSFSCGIQPPNSPQVFIWKNGSPYWRSGPWNNRIFIGIPDMNSVYLDGFRSGEDPDGSFYITFDFVDKSYLSNIALTPQGNLVQIYNGVEDIGWLAMNSDCDVYGKCGAFGTCNPQNTPICSCLQGFKANNAEEWNRGNWTSGCVRGTPLQCERVNAGGDEGKKDGFLKLKMMKVPDIAAWSSAHEDKCREQCLENCSCIGYAYDVGFGCMSWTDKLIDTQQFSSSGVDLYIRVAYSELDKVVDVKKIVTITVIIGTIFIFICTYLLWRWMAKQKARKKKATKILLFNREEAPSKFHGDNLDQVKVQELPLFNFEKLASATNNFHLSNKLGQGGFGPVYWGKLSDGIEIAIKRLSKASGQGLQEFMNEVVVISKLQHRNLVRIFGCCVEGEEKMLIYEYMPNKSLDAFLFDPHKEKLLDWRKRFNIIEGIGRGLLYLHRDSRLKIIHRDLKASNILLDKELNPKIADFGMAKIFGNNEEQANTNRVVGTYGYMSPEYAMEGRFSEKSDVFSFGVLLLEILSGKRNSSFYHDEQSMSLLGFAWKLWNADNIIALIDPMIYEPCFEMEMLRCIHVGLLCVQEFAKDRPIVSVVISMLKSEIIDLPHPKQPAFTERQILSDTDSSIGGKKKIYVNDVTITMVQGR